MKRIEDMFEPVDPEPARRDDCHTTPIDEAVDRFGFETVYAALLDKAADMDARKEGR